MEHQIINFIVSMDRSATIPRLELLVFEESQDFFDMWYLPYGLSRLNIFRSSLGHADRRKGSDLAIVEA